LDAIQAEAVGLLGLVAGQDVEPGEAEGTFRVARNLAADRVISTVDPDARHLHKRRSSSRDGEKAHVAVEPETGLVCAAALTPANAADGPTGVGLLAGEPAGLEVLGDAAYGGGETRAALTAAGHAQTIKPIPLSAAVPGGVTRDDFTIDLQAKTVTCPAGHTLASTPPARRSSTGAAALPAPRALHHRQARQDHQHPSPPRPARRGAAPRRRPGLPGQLSALAADGGTLDRLAGRKGHRRVRYRGLARNQLGLSLRVAAINLRRLVTMGLDHHDAGWRLA
jgi:IS5 family transposase